MEPNIELAKPRDFGEIVSDTFTFIRQNIKYLLKYFFIFCGFFVLAACATSILQDVKVVQTVNNYTADSFVSSGPFAFIGLEFFLYMFFVILAYTAIIVTILCYMALYKVKGNVPPDTEEMWGYFKYYYLKCLGASILLVILLTAGFVLCIIPGVYLYPIFMLILPIMIVENATFGYAFNQAFKLIKDSWWVTFGAIFIISMITSIIAMVVSLPAALLKLGGFLFHIQKGSGQVSLVTTIIGSVLQQIATLFQIILVVGIALCYFSLNESKEGTGLLDRIKDFGTANPDQHTTPEEY